MLFKFICNQSFDRRHWRPLNWWVFLLAFFMGTDQLSLHFLQHLEVCWWLRRCWLIYLRHRADWLSVYINDCCPLTFLLSSLSKKHCVNYFFFLLNALFSFHLIVRLLGFLQRVTVGTFSPAQRIVARTLGTIFACTIYAWKSVVSRHRYFRFWYQRRWRAFFLSLRELQVN